MYLIGFLGSPLPYLFLLGVYLSGFALVNWKAAAQLSAGEPPSENILSMATCADTAMTHSSIPCYLLTGNQEVHANNDATTDAGNQHVAALTHITVQRFHVFFIDLVRMVAPGLTRLCHPASHNIRPPPLV